MGRVKAIRAKRVVGITKLARKLRVTRQHLYLVLHGKRTSARITAALREKNHAGIIGG